MKKLSAIFTILLLAGAVSCKKSTTTSTSTVQDTSETVNVSVNAGESYRYTLPPVNGSNTYDIETGSARAAVVSIEEDATSSTFIYVPPQSTGTSTDQVVVSNTASQSGTGGCGHHHEGPGGGCNHGSGGKHGCGEHHEHHSGGSTSSKHSVIFNITVNGVQN